MRRACSPSSSGGQFLHDGYPFGAQLVQGLLYIIDLELQDNPILAFCCYLQITSANMFSHHRTTIYGYHPIA